ncbi:MAG: LytR family transcriptional regulator [Ruminococcaceae bacterium]|nr:LytR family transcriptional regulator [Oscillospiraceae bacterium]
MKSPSQIKVSATAFVVALVLSLAVFGIIAYVVINGIFFEDNHIDPSTDIHTEQPDDPKNPDEPLPPEVIEEIEGDSFSILVAGYDLTLNGFDAMAVVDVNKEDQTVSIYSVNTDTKVYVGHGDENSQTSSSLNVRIGDLIKYKDINYVLDKVNAVTGLHVDYYITLTAEGFIEAFDEFNSSKDYSYKVPKDMEYVYYVSDGTQDPELEKYNISFKKGDKITSGLDVYNMLRYKSDSDEDRISRQSAFVKEVILKIVPSRFKEGNLSKILDTIKALLKLTGSIDTNISVETFVKETYDLFVKIPDFSLNVNSEFTTSATNYK